MLNNNEKIILDIIIENSIANKFNQNVIKIISEGLSKSSKEKISNNLVNERYKDLIEGKEHSKILNIMKKDNMISDKHILDIIFNSFNDDTVKLKEITNLLKSLSTSKGFGKKFINENKKDLLYFINNLMYERPHYFNMKYFSNISPNIYRDIVKSNKYSDLSDEILFIKKNKLVHIIPLYYKMNKILMKQQDRELLINDVFIDSKFNMNDLMCLLFVLSESELDISINTETKKIIKEKLINDFDIFKEEIHEFSRRKGKNDKLSMIYYFIKDIFKNDIIIDEKLDKFIKGEIVKNSFK